MCESSVLVSPVYSSCQTISYSDARLSATFLCRTSSSSRSNSLTVSSTGSPAFHTCRDSGSIVTSPIWSFCAGAPVRRSTDSTRASSSPIWNGLHR